MGKCDIFARFYAQTGAVGTLPQGRGFAGLRAARLVCGLWQGGLRAVSRVVHGMWEVAGE